MHVAEFLSAINVVHRKNPSVTLWKTCKCSDEPSFNAITDVVVLSSLVVLGPIVIGFTFSMLSQFWFIELSGNCVRVCFIPIKPSWIPYHYHVELSYTVSTL